MTPQEQPRARDVAAPPDRPDPAAWAHNARLGLVLFFVYLALYAGFIALNAFARDAMAKPSLGGVNFAIVYGFGLIVAAFVLAIVYMVLCRPEPPVAPEQADVAELSEGEVAEKLEAEGGP